MAHGCSEGSRVLWNPALVDSIVEKAGLKPTDTVLEIGPARGTSPSASSRPASRPSSLSHMVLELNRPMVPVL
uniref:rRNA adenine N(6)-methyltransferase n=1 Tax=Oryza rufipogon TaxID=4529 RepID=A0A0E0N2H3_ORYRU